MKNYAWLGVIGIGTLVAAACTVNSTTNNNGTGLDGGGEDSSTADGSGSSSSSGGSSSGGSDASTTTDGGGTCAAQVPVAGAACDACVKSHCCSELTACDTADDAGVDDAGMTTCEQLLQCTLTYAATADASLTESISTCSGGEGGMTYSAAAQQLATMLITCTGTNCATECQ
jgi:hypothetical protein